MVITTTAGNVNKPRKHVCRVYGDITQHPVEQSKAHGTEVCMLNAVFYRCGQETI